MNVKLFFDPPPQAVQSARIASGLEKTVYFPGVQEGAWQQSRVALIGVDEYRGSQLATAERAEGSLSAPDQIRAELYRLSALSGPLTIADFGSLRPGQTPEQTKERLTEVCRLLMEAGLIPLIIGGSHDLAFSQYQAYETTGRMITVVGVDARPDLDESSAFADQRHLYDLLVHTPNFLFEYIHLAHQRYLVSPDALAILEKLGSSLISVGKIQEQPAEAEPEIRSADMLAFDLAAVRSDEMRANGLSHPFGLTAQQACQLCWYAGQSENLSSFGLYGFMPGAEEYPFSAKAAAVMIWYFLEGVALRPATYSFEGPNFLRYTVQMGTGLPDLIFLKAVHQPKWWMEINLDGKHNQKYYIPCSRSDYESATQGILPDRWLRVLQKL